MRIVRPGDPTYDASRRISNARFNYFPKYIYYCEGWQDVRIALAKAKEEKLGVRIRSGGHQHEGMCSANDILMVDLSQINQILFSADRNAARIGAGAKLGDIYKQMWANRRLLPGGGCGDVRIGGLVQGGGWGPYSRALGLTCDTLAGFSMVTAGGEFIEVTDSKADPHRDLLWAVRGGGGGNFGVITHFNFRLASISAPVWQFTLSWGHPNMIEPVVEEWRQNFPNDGDLRLTSFCRLSSPAGTNPPFVDPPVIVAGFFLDDQVPLKALLERLLPTTYSKAKASFSPVNSPGVEERAMVLQHAEYQPGPPRPASNALLGAGIDPPSETCDGGWYPHKVSSCFPRSGFSREAIDTIVKYLVSSSPEPEARRYLSLHGMGGAINNDPARSQESCFAFREKPFMLQYQAWWADRENQPLGQRCLAWVRDFRERMKPHTEGSFINFPDKDLVPNPGTPEGRKALLRYYYAGNLEGLIEKKCKYDQGEFFNFEMGIPTK
jgi:hypothetical protein